MAEQTLLDRMMVLTDTNALITMAGENGLPETHVTFLEELVSSTVATEENGGRTPVIVVNRATLGREFQQGLLILFSWEGDEEPTFGFMLAFSEDVTRIIGSQALSKEELRAAKSPHQSIN